MIEAHLRMLRVRDVVSADEERAIAGLFAETREISADQIVTRAGETLSASTLILDGLLCRYKDHSDGQRQITALHVPGDFADLHGFTLKRLDHNIMALTRCRIALAPHDRLSALTREQPHIARLYWFLTNLDAAIHREWVMSLGLRTAAARIAHLLCELHLRLGVVGLTEETSYGLGLTQTDLAECLGLTPVHVNRSLRRLREQGLVEFRSGRVTIHDLAGLQRIAEFDPAYLYLDCLPR